MVVIDKYKKVVEGLMECGRQSEGRKEGIRPVVKVSCWIEVVNRREEVEMEVVKVVSQSVVLRVKQSGRRDSRRSARRVVGSVEGY